ncbi:MAG TPA: FtsX-like permease family protein [Candidatus Dormibacteraeota bacterium]|nr:FtsX-like permease family protein [Candidatus Dormibacteraeota bacterium]
MTRLAPLAWRSLRARPVRTLLTALGVALGVAVLAATVVTSESISSAIDRTVTDVVGRADLTISAFGDAGLSDASIAAVAALPGVDAAAPSIQRRTFLGPGVVAGGTSPAASDPVAVLGIDPALDPRVRDLVLVRGSALARPDEPSALIGETMAAATGLDVGSSLTLDGAATAPADAGTFRIIGVIRGDGPVIGAGGRVVVIPIARARALFALPGVTSVSVALRAGASIGDVRSSLASVVAEPYVLSTPADIAASLRASTGDFRSTMALIAVVALFAGAFLIFNTLSMTVTERVRDVALLRAAGATRRQVAMVVLLGAIVIGVAGSLAGLAAGVALAALTTSLVHTAFGLRTALDLPAAGLAFVGVIGVLVALAAALEPAIRAARIPPAEALRSRGQPGLEGRARLRWLIVVAAVVAAVGIALWPRATGDLDIVRPAAVYALLLVFALASPRLLGPLGRLAGIPFGWFAGVEERLARGALGRDSSRTALTVGALTVGIALVVAVGTVAFDARRSASDWLVSVVPGDELLTTVSPVSLDENGPLADLRAVDGVARVSPIATFAVGFQGLRLDAAAVSGADLAEDGRLVFVSGDRDAALGALDRGGSVVLPRAASDVLGLGVGDTMTVAGPGGGEVQLNVAGIVERGIPGRSGEAVLVGWPDATGRLGVKGADSLAVRYEVGAGDTARTAEDALARSLGLQPVSLDRLQGAVTDALDRVFGLFDALAIVAVVVAALGIVNTLSMDVLERVREIGILRAAGMTRRQVGRMVVVEAGIIGVVGAVLGIAAGLASGALMLLLSGARSAPTLAIPWSTLALAVVLGVGLAMVAAYYPARLASRLTIVRAVRVE